MTTERDLINDYLDRLDRAAQVLAPDRRVELLTEIREHINEARSGVEGKEEGKGDGEVDGASEAAVRSLLERLGEPEEIVTAAAEGSEPWRGAAQPSAAPPRSLALEIWAVLMLTVGSVLLPVVGWLGGLVMLWSSSRWRIGEKLLGTLVVPGGLGGFLIYGFIGSSVDSCFSSASTVVGAPSSSADVVNTCDDPGAWTDWLLPVGLGVAALAALAVPLYLLYLARSRADAEAAAGARFSSPVPGSAS
jgi:hypothetical protein